MSVLVSEILIILFATLVGHGLRLADLGVVWGVGGGAMVLCALAAALLRRGPVGYIIGSAVQVLLIASGAVVPMMYAVGAIFAILWIAAMRVGGRIDVERQERYLAEVEHHRSSTGSP